jgi:general L-amino acid transport system permease protein
VGFFLLRGHAALPALERVEINLWGGLIVTAILAIGGILISFPFGVLLALGRRSTLPVVSAFSTAFIELIRGVPLISILFLFSLIVPLFLPANMRFDRMLRALVGMIVFSAAYTAENVRGGLQAIPSGQYEAAYAIGLRNLQITLLIVLPQALRKVIPAIVGQFISLFKDTTLASGVAVLEILSIGRSVLQGNPEYIGLQAEVFVFVAAIFWIFSYSMSVSSRRIETQLGVGQS